MKATQDPVWPSRRASQPPRHRELNTFDVLQRRWHGGGADLGGFTRWACALWGLGGLLVGLGLLGCADQALRIDDLQARQLANLAHPNDAPLGADLDVVVHRDAWGLVLLNRTAHDYRDVHLWLNQQYVTKLDHLPIGREVWIPLANFINEHVESFPTGGLLTPDKARPVVLVEMVTLGGGLRDTTASGVVRHRLLKRG